MVQKADPKITFENGSKESSMFYYLYLKLIRKLTNKSFSWHSMVWKKSNNIED